LRIAIARRDGPVALVLTRQGLPVLDLARYPNLPAGVPLGGYVFADTPSGVRPDIILIATGSEVHLALEGRDRLMKEDIQARVVSLPSTDIFSTQSDRYRDEVLPPGVPLLAIEAGASLGWRSYVGPQIAVIGVDTFGASAPGPVVMQHYGFTVENVCKQTHHVLRQVEEKS
jgi:transketolase